MSNRIIISQQCCDKERSKNIKKMTTRRRYCQSTSSSELICSPVEWTTYRGQKCINQHFINIGTICTFSSRNRSTFANCEKATFTHHTTAQKEQQNHSFKITCERHSIVPTGKHSDFPTAELSMCMK